MIMDGRGVFRQPDIEAYGFLSDCHSAALVDRDGSVDWWCLPRFDSPSVFGRLLDGEAGHWSLAPEAPFTSTRCYVGDSLVLRTTFTTEDGVATVTEGLLLEAEARGHELGLRSPHVLARVITGVSGSVPLRMTLAPRMEYGLTEPTLTLTEGGAVARGGPITLTLSGPLPLWIEAGAVHAWCVVAPGESVELRLTYSPTFGPGSGPDAEGANLDQTGETWQSWSAEHTGYDGAFPELVKRSSIILQGLTYGPSGAVVAAATTSLPETMGGELNFDYRFAWLRDLSLTFRALWLASCPDEPTRMFHWLSASAGHTLHEQVQIMYGVEGERDLTEHVLEHLTGYHGSAPVRVGNAAWQQSQLDIFGEVLDAAHLLAEQLEDMTPASRQMLVTMADRAARTWTDKDAGMWEARDEPRHYTSSKVMCWVALDRAIDLAPRLGDDCDTGAWTLARDAVRTAVLDRAWSEEAGVYAGALGSDELDASVLLLPLVGFLPADDERMLATIDAIETRLGDGPLVRRWADDRSGFLICTYWLVECLAMAGRRERAEAWFVGATGLANDLGLLSEEADPATGLLLGNYPQAFSHVGLINAAWRLGQVR